MRNIVIALAASSLLATGCPPDSAKKDAHEHKEGEKHVDGDEKKKDAPKETKEDDHKHKPGEKHDDEKEKK